MIGAPADALPPRGEARQRTCFRSVATVPEYLQGKPIQQEDHDAMKRRTFIRTAATAALGAAAAPLAAPAVAQGITQWTMVTAWPRNLPGPGVAAQMLADRITELSGGRLTVELHAAGELVPDAVSSMRCRRAPPTSTTPCPPTGVRSRRVSALRCRHSACVPTSRWAGSSRPGPVAL